ncbi:MAG: hypothetical protein U0905_11615 [Pirellulales bacterium]
MKVYERGPEDRLVPEHAGLDNVMRENVEIGTVLIQQQTQRFIITLFFAASSLACESNTTQCASEVEDKNGKEFGSAKKNEPVIAIKSLGPTTARALHQGFREALVSPSIVVESFSLRLQELELLPRAAQAERLAG